MTLTEFIAEIETSLESFSSSGDIDRNTIKMHVISRLRLFGNNIVDLKEKILKIENSQCFLPEDFKSLKLALKLEPFGCNEQPPTSSYIYRQRIENPAFFDRVTQEYITSCNSKIVTEKIIIDNKSFNFYYHPQWLSLVKGIKKESLAVDCLNLHPSIRQDYKDKISINNSILNTNFSKGSVYIQYNSLPTDENDELIIPEITTGDILTYITQYVKVMIAEDLIINNKNAQGLAQLYPSWKQELVLLKKAALTEAAFAGIDKNWAKKFKAKSKLNTATFDLPSLRF